MAGDAIQKFQTIIRHLIGTDSDSLSQIDVSAQFDPSVVTKEGEGKSINAAFLITLSGESHPLYEKASRYLIRTHRNDHLEAIRDFFRSGLELLYKEVDGLSSGDKSFMENLNDLYNLLEDRKKHTGRMEVIEKVRAVFFPEGAGICQDKEERITELREKRKITVSRLNPRPIINPDKEILFTSNVLITTPASSQNIEELSLSESLKKRIDAVVKEDQLFWYDHPIQIGVESERNEALYGLRGLEEALRFELDRGTLEPDASLDCVLSVSTTHRGLQDLTMDYLKEEFAKGKGTGRLNIYLFTESNSIRMIEEILKPAAERYLANANTDLLNEIIGVDGEYGRHYSFLKAISAFWHVFINPDIRGTFKIDLDQVFPQKLLVEQVGTSAFQHFTSPLWGAEGIDSNGEKIELGMIAGTLVNEKDICESLYCPDVCFPPEKITGDELIFYSSLPQALSTEAEMMTRYHNGPFNGSDHCIQRIHVTGGTCGILVDSLRRYRPFTPTFIGRAEDQAYLLSALFVDPETNLRYVHKDGLIMRHDKEVFAQEAIKSAYLGKLAGDYARILWFSYYVRALPWQFERTKELIDPFTGCFVSRIPFTVVYLRLALKVASLFSSVNAEENTQGFELLAMGCNRLGRIARLLQSDPDYLVNQYRKEKEGWDIYYDILDHVENGLKTYDPFAHELRESARSLVNDCMLTY